MDLTLFTFAAMALVVVMTPGPTVLLALSNGSRFGFARSGWGILGAALSDAVLITAAALGLGAVMAGSAVLFGIAKWVGVAYLLWIGVQMLRSSVQIGAAGAADADGDPRRIFRKSFLAAVTNPKGYLFFTAFLPQFLTLDAPLPGQYALLAAIFIAVDVAVMSAYAGLGSRAMALLKNRGGLWIERVCGGVLVSLGVALAFVRRAEA